RAALAGGRRASSRLGPAHPPRPCPPGAKATVPPPSPRRAVAADRAARARGPTAASFVIIQQSRIAPARMAVSKSTMLSRTTAPMSTRTPGERIECSTVPATWQPWPMRLLWRFRRAAPAAGRPSHVAAVADGAVVDVRGRPDARRRPFLGAGVDEPAAVVQVELRTVCQQVHVRLPVALDRAHVLPVSVEAVAVDAGAAAEHGGGGGAARVRGCTWP